MFSILLYELFIENVHLTLKQPLYCKMLSAVEETSNKNILFYVCNIWETPFNYRLFKKVQIYYQCESVIFHSTPFQI